MFAGEKNYDGHDNYSSTPSNPSDNRDNEQISISAQRVGFFSIGSGRVGYWTKYRVGSECRKIQSGVFGYLFYFRVFPGISGYFG